MESVYPAPNNTKKSMPIGVNTMANNGRNKRQTLHQPVFPATSFLARSLGATVLVMSIVEQCRKKGPLITTLTDELHTKLQTP